VTRVIEPLASRCAKFRFQSLPPASMKNRLLFIAEKEGCVVEDSHLDSILEFAEGDMRRAVTTLQSVHALGHVDDKGIAELAGMPPSSVVDKLVQALHSNQFDPMRAAVENICAEGYSAQILLGCLLQRFVKSNDLDELGRAKLAIRIAEAEHHMIDGADEYLQLMTVCGLAMQCFQSAKVAMETH
jgi:replication factor C subunit 2/4